MRLCDKDRRVTRNKSDGRFGVLHRTTPFCLIDSKQNLTRSFNVLVFETIQNMDEVQPKADTSFFSIIENNKPWKCAKGCEIAFNLNMPALPHQPYGAICDLMSKAFCLEARLRSFQSEELAPTRRQHHLGIRRLNEAVEPCDTLRVNVGRSVEGTIYNDDTFAIGVVSPKLCRIENTVDVKENEPLHNPPEASLAKRKSYRLVRVHQ